MLGYKEISPLLEVVGNHLHWKTSSGGRIAGRRAGCLKNNGYITVMLLGKFYQAHRLIWLLTYGVWPPSHVDHINGDRSDNRISNLRLCSQLQNNQNKSLATNNKSGFKGVFYRAHSRKYQALITVNGIQKYLGRYERAEDAARVYDAACIEFFGAYAKPNFPVNAS